MGSEWDSGGEGFYVEKFGADGGNDPDSAGGVVACRAGNGASAAVPSPVADEARATAPGKEDGGGGGGMFLGNPGGVSACEGRGQRDLGIFGRDGKDPDYEAVSSGQTGHAESVAIVYDPSQVTYGELLRVFFSVALNPTEVNRQGPDSGTQYRSVIFYGNDEQKRLPRLILRSWIRRRFFRKAIATQVVPLKAFYKAEDYFHQNYATIHPNDPYIMFNDAPKVANLRREFPEIYK